MEIYFLLEQHFLVQSDCTFLLLCQVLFQEFLQRVILLLMLMFNFV